MAIDLLNSFIPETVTFANYLTGAIILFYFFWRYYVRCITCIGYFILKVSCDKEQRSV